MNCSHGTARRRRRRRRRRSSPWSAVAIALWMGAPTVRGFRPRTALPKERASFLSGRSCPHQSLANPFAFTSIPGKGPLGWVGHPLYSSNNVFPEVPEETDCAIPPSPQDCRSDFLDDDGDDAMATTFTETLNEVSPDTEEGLTSDEDLHWFRFAGVGRLYEDEVNPENVILDRLKRATVAVVGLGGVGSWTAEALCRSGIGHLVLVDLDDICISNTNRQLHTLSNNVGALKTQAMRQRLVDIHPYCNITLIHDFVMLDNAQEIVGEQFKNLHVDVVIDAIDGDEEKAGLVAACADHGIPVVSTGSPAGKSDPTQIVVDDIAQVRSDALLRSCRNRLCKDFGFTMQTEEDGKLSNQQVTWNIPCVYSKQGEKINESTEMNDDDIVTSSFRCDGNMGTACFVTGTFGFVAASRVVEMIVDESMNPPKRN